jgi:hypothetical protein
MSDDIVCTRLFSDDGTLAFDQPRTALVAHHAALEARLATMTEEEQAAHLSDSILLAMSMISEKVDDAPVFAKCVAAMYNLVSRQPQFDALTASYIIGVALNEGLRFNAFGSYEKNQFDFHCQNLKKIFAERRGEALPEHDDPDL